MDQIFAARYSYPAAAAREVIVIHIENASVRITNGVRGSFLGSREISH